MPFSESETATREPSGEGTNQSMAVAPARVERVRIDEHPPAGDVVEAVQHDEERLLPRGLLPECEEARRRSRAGASARSTPR